MKPITFIISIILGSSIGILGFLFAVKKNLIDTSYRAYVVTSGSMEPNIKTGSIIITKEKPDYFLGDVVTFKNGSHVVTHRIINMDETTITTKGDANSSADLATTPKENIIGGNFFIVPYLGWVVDFAKTPRGFVALIVIPASIIIYEELKSLLAEGKKLLGKITFRQRAKFSPMSLMLTLTGFGLLLGAGVKFVGATQSGYLDRNDYLGNSFQAASEFGSATPPSPSPSPLPSPSPTPTPDLNLVINEFMANPDGEGDWVEIYNPTSSSISLTGWALDEGDQNPKPLGSLGTILPGGFVVYEHTNTSWLDINGETIELLSPANQVIDSYTYTSSSKGISIGRHPDGGDWTTCTTPSKNASNNGVCQP